MEGAHPPSPSQIIADCILYIVLVGVQLSPCQAK